MGDFVGGPISDALGLSGGGDDAADAATEGAEIQAQSQREALEYLKQTEQLPQAYREQAMAQLGSLYGLPGLGSVPYGGFAGQDQAQAQPEQQFYQPTGDYMMLNPAYAEYQEWVRANPDGEGRTGLISGVLRPNPYKDGKPQQYIKASDMPEMPIPGTSVQPMQGQAGQDAYTPMGMQEFVDSLRQNPFYTSMLDQGEQAVMRQSSATGGMRSGGIQEGLAQNSQNVLQGFYNQQVQGLQGLAGTASNANAIASQMSGIGQTLGQGTIASAQAEEAARQQQNDALMQAGQIATMAFFSDRRLKDNITLVGKYADHNLYTWEWNDKAKRLGLDGEGYGVIADEVEKINPSAVTIVDGYQQVDYGSLGVN